MCKKSYTYELVINDKHIGTRVATAANSNSTVHWFADK